MSKQGVPRTHCECGGPAEVMFQNARICRRCRELDAQYNRGRRLANAITHKANDADYYVYKVRVPKNNHAIY